MISLIIESIFFIFQIEIAEQELLTCETKLDKIERKIRISDLTDLQL